MKRRWSVGCSLIAALLLATVGATSAGAVDINPDNTPVEGIAADPTVTYAQQVVVVCDESVVGGSTGSGTDPTIALDLTLGPNPGGCTINGAGATASCSGTFEVSVLDGHQNTGTASPNDDLLCVVTVPFACTLELREIDGPHDPGPAALDEVEDLLEVELPMWGTRTGTGFCGPASGPALFEGSYAMSPAELTFEP
jgi:hypothetical protein